MGCRKCDLPRTTQNLKLGLLKFSSLSYTKLSNRNNLAFLQNDRLAELQAAGSGPPLTSLGPGAKEVVSLASFLICRKEKKNAYLDWGRMK